MKNVLTIHRQGEGHWVGDGFPVHTVFHYQERPELTPFISSSQTRPYGALSASHTTALK